MMKGRSKERISKEVKKPKKRNRQTKQYTAKTHEEIIAIGKKKEDRENLRKERIQFEKRNNSHIVERGRFTDYPK